MAERRPTSSPGYLLWRVQNRWRAAMTEALAPFGLTHVQFALLASVMWLTEEEGIEATQNDVGDHSGADPTMTSQVLRTLEERKLVSRKKSKSDGRARVVALLAAGRKVTVQALSAVKKVDAEFFDARLDDAERFRAELQRLEK